jgi:hypothetical protein
LLALGVRLLAVLARILRVLLRVCWVFSALVVIALPVMFSGSAVRSGSVFMVFGCFIMFVSSHRTSPAGVKGNVRKTTRPTLMFQLTGAKCSFAERPLCADRLVPGKRRL